MFANRLSGIRRFLIAGAAPLTCAASQEENSPFTTMTKITEVAFVAYPVSDINRARDFYENGLGLPVGEFDHEIEGTPGQYWIEYDVGNVAFAISNAWEPSGQSGPSVAFEVDDLKETVSHLKKAGVRFLADNIDTPVCSFALIADPDGNAITIHKRKAR
jgi:predicted enzyme related to lactoylglutathione lyase